MLRVAEQAEEMKKNLHPALLMQACLFFWISLLGNFWSVLSFPSYCKPTSVSSCGSGIYFQVSVGIYAWAPFIVIVHDSGANSCIFSTFLGTAGS